MARRASGGIHKPKRIAKHEQKHYWPYLPMLALVFVLFIVSALHPAAKFRVLPYATEMSRSQLLASSNEYRTNNKKKVLSLNSKLNSAAQAKAQDMVKRDYWSHNTPDGQEPWVFFENAKYVYLKAGENLAYGFTTSQGAVTGWMNSPSHRDNLLDPVFEEVGFGFANSENFNDSGQQTVVVAMYGDPQVLAESAPAAPAPAPEPSPQPAAEPVPQAKPEPTPPRPQIKTSPPITNETLSNVEPASLQIARVENIAGLNQPWVLFATGAITGILVAVLLVRHAIRLRHLLRDSERFIIKHPMLDILIVAVIILGAFLSQTAGVIR